MKNKIYSKKSIYYIVGFSLLFLLVLSVQSVWAFSAKEIGNAVMAAFISVIALIFYYFTLFLFWVVGIILAVLVQIAAYQDIINNPVVIESWTVVRDIVNVLFVLVLLYVSFSVVINKESNWQSKLLKLLAAIILVNFSRMFVGIFIDLSNVIMITFVNGFRNVAAGNIINGLQLSNYLNEYTDVFTTDLKLAQNRVVSYLTATVVGVFLLGILTLLVIYLLVRIVKLWLLTIMSPLIALSYVGVGGKISDFANTWNKEFSEALVGGPFMAFVIWFNLSIISKGGDIMKVQQGADKMAQGTFNRLYNQVYLSIIVVVLLYGSYKMALEMSGSVARSIYGKVKDLTKAAGGLAWKGLKFTDRFIGEYTGAKLGRQFSVGMTVEKMKEWGRGVYERQYNQRRKIWLEEYTKKREERIKKKHEPRLIKLDREKDIIKSELEQKEKVLSEKGIKVKKLFSVYQQTELLKESKDEIKAILSDSIGFNLSKGLNDKLYIDLNKAIQEGNWDKVKKIMSNYDMKVTDRQILDDLVEKKVIDGRQRNLLMTENSKLSKEGLKEKARLITELREASYMSEKLSKGGDNIDESVVKYFTTDRSNDLIKVENLDKKDLEIMKTGKVSLKGLHGKQYTEYSELQGELSKLKEKLNRTERELTMGIKKDLIAFRRGPSYRINMTEVENRDKDIRKFLDEEFRYVDDPSEIASYLKIPEQLTREEFNYLLEKSKDDLSEVLRHLELPETMDSLKYLYARQKNILTEAEIKEIEEQLRENGELSLDKDKKLVEKLNKKLTKYDFEIIQRIGQKNEKDNATFAFATVRNPDGITKLPNKEEHAKFVNESYLNGDLSTEAMTRFFIRSEKGDKKLSKAGFNYLLRYSKDVEKAAINGELSKGLWDAIRNSKDDVLATLEKAVEKEAITKAQKKSVEKAIKAVTENISNLDESILKGVIEDYGKREKENNEMIYTELPEDKNQENGKLKITKLDQNEKDSILGKLDKNKDE